MKTKKNEFMRMSTTKILSRQSQIVDIDKPRVIELNTKRRRNWKLRFNIRAKEKNGINIKLTDYEQ